jgi:hypothetical protein
VAGRRQLAAARGGGAIPAVAGQGGELARRSEHQHGRVASGRAAMARGPAQGQLAACARGGGMAAAAAQLWPSEGGTRREGKEVGKHESNAGKLTNGSIGAEEGRRGELDGRGGARRSFNGVRRPAASIPADGAQPSTRWSEEGGGRGCAAWGAANRGTAARGGRNRHRRGDGSARAPLRAPHERGKGNGEAKSNLAS